MAESYVGFLSGVIGFLSLQPVFFLLEKFFVPFTTPHGFAFRSGFTLLPSLTFFSP